MTTTVQHCNRMMMEMAMRILRGALSMLSAR
jgi:hypothetical protein